jgi:hypothetical protein
VKGKKEFSQIEGNERISHWCSRKEDVIEYQIANRIRNRTAIMIDKRQKAKLEEEGRSTHTRLLIPHTHTFKAGILPGKRRLRLSL